MQDLQPPLITLTPETLAEAFPPALAVDAAFTCRALRGLVDLTYQSDRFELCVGDADIAIPARILFRSRNLDRLGLTDRQLRIAQCLFTRSTDGFWRQSALQHLFTINQPWSIPFVIALIGEYVIEILDDIDNALPTMEHRLLKSFLDANPAFYRLTQARVTSYWDVYYRADHRRGDYVGFRILDALEAIRRENRSSLAFGRA